VSDHGVLRFIRLRHLVLAVLAALVLGAAASALTGVGPAKHLSGQPNLDLEPEGPNRSVSAEQPSRAGTQTMRAYTNASHEVCIESPAEHAGTTPGLGFACVSVDELPGVFERDAVFATLAPTEVGAAPQWVLFGVIDGDVRDLAVEDVRGWRTGAALTEQLHTGGQPGGSVRGFIAVLGTIRPGVERPVTLRADKREARWPASG
jgi:hypothetical protein